MNKKSVQPTMNKFTKQSMSLGAKNYDNFQSLFNSDKKTDSLTNGYGLHARIHIQSGTSVKMGKPGIFVLTCLSN